MGLGAVEFRTAKVVTGPRPDVTRAVPTLLLLAGRSRTHDPRRVAARAERTLAGVRIATLAGVTHHSLPYADPDALGRRCSAFCPPGFLAGPPDGGAEVRPPGGQSSAPCSMAAATSAVRASSSAAKRSASSFSASSSSWAMRRSRLESPISKTPMSA